MKTVYIPKGETVRYESLTTEHLVVHGCLEVTRGIKARTIAGSGTVRAGAVNADVIRVDDMDAGSIVCKRLLARDLILCAERVGKPRSLKHGARGHGHASAAQEDKLDVRAAAVGKNIWKSPALAVLAVIADAPVVHTVAPRGAAVGHDRRSGGNGQFIGKVCVNGVSRSVRRAVRQGKNIGVAGAGKLKLRSDLWNAAGAAGKTVFFCKHIASVRA